MNEKVIFCVAIFVIGGIVTYLEINRYVKDKKQKEQQSEVTRKDNIIMETLVLWVQIEHEKKDISALLREMNYKKIGIYGYGYLGKQLERVLSDSLVEIVCVIDKKAGTRRNGERIYSPGDPLPAMDAIVVASPFYYAEIKDNLEKLNVQTDSISIDALLYQL